MQQLHSFASEYQEHVQLGDFLESDDNNWIMAYCEVLQQSESQWRDLT
jgi:hypothetical protein